MLLRKNRNPASGPVRLFVDGVQALCRKAPMVKSLRPSRCRLAPVRPRPHLSHWCAAERLHPCPALRVGSGSRARWMARSASPVLRQAVHAWLLRWQLLNGAIVLFLSGTILGLWVAALRLFQRSFPLLARPGPGQFLVLRNVLRTFANQNCLFLRQG